jgi:glutathione S-transferase
MYVLIGSQHSLYTGKLRAYLRYKGIPFEEIVASQDVYKTAILPRTGIAYIPVLVCPDGSTADNSSSSRISSSTGRTQSATHSDARLVSKTATAVLQDSHAIILQLEQVYPGHPVVPAAPQQHLAAMLLELYGDEHLLLPAMHYRWSYPEHATYMQYQFGE